MSPRPAPPRPASRAAGGAPNGRAGRVRLAKGLQGLQGHEGGDPWPPAPAGPCHSWAVHSVRIVIACRSLSAGASLLRSSSLAGQIDFFFWFVMQVEVYGRKTLYDSKRDSVRPLGLAGLGGAWRATRHKALLMLATPAPLPASLLAGRFWVTGLKNALKSCRPSAPPHGRNETIGRVCVVLIAF